MKTLAMMLFAAATPLLAQAPPWTSEIGFAYLGNGTLAYNFTGTECSVTTPSACQSATTDTAFQSNVTAARAKYQKDVTDYGRFFPILKEGFSWRF